MIKNTMPFVYFQGRVIPSHQATISIASHSLQYGTTCFGGIRGYFHEGKARVFRLEDHYIRLNQASKILGMEIKLSWEEFRNLIKNLIESNTPKEDFYI